MDDLKQRLRVSQDSAATAAEVRATMAEAAAALDALEAALRKVMIGGNHLALWLPEPCPPVETEPLDALEQIGAGIHYDVWCAWRSIMIARAALTDQ